MKVERAAGTGATPAASVWYCGQGAGELAAGADAERGEHLAQVVSDGRRADEQLRGDLGIRGTPGGQPGDMRFARGQGVSRLLGLLGGALTGGTQLDPGPLGER